MRWTLPVVIALILAGCTEAPGATDAGGDHMDDGQHMMTNVTFHDVTLDLTEAYTGTFAAQDAATFQGVAATAGQPNTAVQSHDITSLIPAGVPVFVEAQVVAGNVVTWIGADDFAAIWTSACDGCNAFGAGSGWSGAILNTGQSFTVNAFYAGNAVPSEMPYELEVRITTAPDQIPSGMVIAVDMPAVGSHILFEGDVPDVMVFDPDDVYLTTLPASDPQMYIEENMSVGEYVFLPIGHGAFYKLRSGMDVAAGDELTVEARILTQEIRTTGPHAVTQDTEMTFDLERQPLQMGAAYFGVLSQDATVTLASPSGVEVQAGHSGLGGPGVGAFDQTTMGDARLEPGTYTLTWDDAANDGSMQVQEFFTLYSR